MSATRLVTCLATRLMIGALLLMAVGCDETHHARVQDGAGLHEGSPVLVSGVSVGEVSEVQIVEGEVDIEFSIDSDHEITVRQDTCALTTRGEGSPALILRLGTGAPAAQDGPAIPQCEPEVPPLGDFLGQLGDGFGQLMEQLGVGFFGGGGNGGGSGGSGPTSPTPLLGLPPIPSPTNPPTANACQALSVRPDGVERVDAIPGILADGGHRLWLRFSNAGTDRLTVSALGEATFVDTERHSLRVTPMPGETGAWFSPFEVAGGSSERVSVVFAGTSAPSLDEIEVRQVRLAGTPSDESCLFSGTHLAAR